MMQFSQLEYALTNRTFGPETIDRLLATPQEWREKAFEIYFSIAGLLAEGLIQHTFDLRTAAIYLGRLEKVVPIPPAVAYVLKGVFTVANEGRETEDSKAFSAFINGLPANLLPEQKERTRQALDDMVGTAIDDYNGGHRVLRLASLIGAYAELFGTTASFSPRLHDVVKNALGMADYATAAAATKAMPEPDMKPVTGLLSNLIKMREMRLELFSQRKMAASDAAAELDYVADTLQALSKAFGQLPHGIEAEVFTMADKITRHMDARFANSGTRRIGLQYFATLIGYVEANGKRAADNLDEGHLRQLKAILESESAYIQASGRFGPGLQSRLVSTFQKTYRLLFQEPLPAITEADIHAVQARVARAATREGRSNL